MASASEIQHDRTALARALELIELLAVEVGPRRPTTPAEALARERTVEWLRGQGLEAEVEPFDGYSSFAWPFGLIQALSVLPSLLPARLRRVRSLLALGGGAALAAEGGLRHAPLSAALSVHPSGNVVARIEPSRRAERTLVLMCHLDTSRSGLMFDPRFVGMLGRWIEAQSAAGLLQAVAEPLLGGTRLGRRLLALLRLPLAAGVGLLLDRELRGEEVPGANDNASGCGVAAALAAEIAEQPLERSRVVLLMTGCEEAGTLGARAFLDAHDTEGWLFLNFDNVGGDCSIRFLRSEGVLSKWAADPGLILAAQRVADERPELRMAPEDDPAGLTYDSSPVLARGGRALTLSAQDGYIPDLHWPSDTFENLDRGAITRAVEAGRGIIDAVEAGLADTA